MNTAITCLLEIMYLNVCLLWILYTYKNIRNFIIILNYKIIGFSISCICINKSNLNVKIIILRKAYPSIFLCRVSSVIQLFKCEKKINQKKSKTQAPTPRKPRNPKVPLEKKKTV